MIVTQTVESALHAPSSMEGVATTAVTAVGWYKLDMYAIEASREDRALGWLGDAGEAEAEV